MSDIPKSILMRIHDIVILYLYPEPNDEALSLLFARPKSDACELFSQLDSLREDAGLVDLTCLGNFQQQLGLVPNRQIYSLMGISAHIVI